MIEVELQFQVRPRELLNEPHGKIEVLQEISRDIAPIDRLDHDFHAARREVIGGKGNVVAVGGDCALIVARSSSRHHMHALGAGRFGIMRGQCDAVLEIACTVGQGG